MPGHGLNGESFSTFASAPRQYPAAANGGFSCTKAMGAFSLQIFGLKGALHFCSFKIKFGRLCSNVFEINRI